MRSDAPMRSIQDFIDALGGPSTVAGALNLSATTVASWKARKSIPVGYWASLCELAHDRGKDISYEGIAKIHIEPASEQESAA